MQDKYLEFITPTRVVYQCGGAAQASDVLGRIGIKRPYVVADEGVAKAGVVESAECFFEKPFLNWQVEVVGGVKAEQCATTMTEFFAARRAGKKKLKKASPAAD